MRFTPYENFTVDSNLSLDAAVSKLSNALEPDLVRPGYSKAGYAFDNLGRFEGTVNRDGFHIQRVTTWSWNAFIPVVYGSFNVDRKGVNVNVHLMLHPLVKWFAIAWYAMILALLITSVVKWSRTGVMDDGFIVALTFGLFFYILMIVNWSAGVHKIRRFLNVLFAQNEV